RSQRSLDFKPLETRAFSLQHFRFCKAQAPVLSIAIGTSRWAETLNNYFQMSNLKTRITHLNQSLNQQFAQIAFFNAVAFLICTCFPTKDGDYFIAGVFTRLSSTHGTFNIAALQISL